MASADWATKPPAGLGTAALRAPAIGVAIVLVLCPILLVVYQSFLSDPFFTPSAQFTLDAYRFVLEDPDFWRALWTTLALAAGMTLIAVSIGTVLAFIMVRTDVPGPVLDSAARADLHIGGRACLWGDVVAAGPVGIVSTWVKDVIGVVPWDIYSLPSLIVIAVLTHVPHVYLYTAAGLRGIGSDVEEAARIVGASPFRVALAVSLPMVRPSIAFASVLVFFLGFEVFGLPLVLGDPAQRLVLTTYLYKLTNILGTPSYQLMAVVVVVIILIAAPLVAPAAPPAARCRPLRIDARQGPQDRTLAARLFALAGTWRDPSVGSRHRGRAHRRHRAALLRRLVG